MLRSAATTTSVVLAVATAAADPQPPVFETRTLVQPLDHFSYNAQRSGSLPVRYLVNLDGCAGNITDAIDLSLSAPCPVIYYCGNEDDIGAFVNSTGFLWQLRMDLKAALVYVEHRYYGTSQPNATASAPDAFEFLSSQQVLADFASVAAVLQKSGLGPVLAVGGSYGGMLAAWCRQKYPGLFTAALASSAPVLAFQDRSLTNPAAPLPTGYWGARRRSPRQTPTPSDPLSSALSPLQ
jgi:hypothetical protein